MRNYVKITLPYRCYSMSTPHIENSNYTENDDHLPNLLNNTVTYDHIIEQSANIEDGAKKNDVNLIDNMLKELENLATTDTDMMVGYFANNEKLVSDIQQFIKPDKDAESSRYDSDKDDDIDRYTKDSKHHSESSYTHDNKGHSYTDDRKDSEHHSKATDYSFKGGSHGPSVGSGATNKEYRSSGEGKYSGFNSEEELNIAKLNIMKKLAELSSRYGVKLSQNYNMKSDYNAMKHEYDMHYSIRCKDNGIKWLSSAMLQACWGLELLNENYNPFDFKLKGWSEQMNSDIGEYYEVLGDLYEKYCKPGSSMPPELKLMFMVSGSAIKFHIAQATLGSIPSLRDKLMSNPNLLSNLTGQNTNTQNVNDKLQEEYGRSRQNSAFQEKVNNNHEEARRTMQDIHMLKEKEAEYQQTQQLLDQQHQQRLMNTQIHQNRMMQDQILQKQKELEDLQKQLDMQRSDTFSHYSHTSRNNPPRNVNFNQQQTMQMPDLPPSLRNRMKQNNINVIRHSPRNSPRGPRSPASLRSVSDNEIGSSLSSSRGPMGYGRGKRSPDLDSIDPDIDRVIIETISDK